MTALLLLACQGTDLYARENLHAWLVMFADPVERTPDERARMVRGLGFRKVGFEAFDRFVPIFEEQVDAYRRHGVDLLSLWFTFKTDAPSREPHVRSLLDVLRRRSWTPQVWAMFPREHLERLPEGERLDLCVRAFSDLARAVAAAGSRLSLYNYGGWSGDAEVQLAVIRGVRERTGLEIGTVFNFHRGHAHMDRFEKFLARLLPHLTAVHLNGMRADGPLILPVGRGDGEAAMMRILQDSGWRGPVGVIDHRPGVDAERALRENLEGLDRLRGEPR